MGAGLGRACSARCLQAGARGARPASARAAAQNPARAHLELLRVAVCADEEHLEVLLPGAHLLESLG